MSLILLEGFDDGLASYTKRFSGLIGTLEAAGRHGATARRLRGPTEFHNWAIPPALQHATVIVGFALNRADGAAKTSVLRLQGDGGATTHLAVGCTATGLVTVSSGAVVLGGTDDFVLTPDVWHYLEVFATLSDTTGAVKLRLDGVAPPGWTDLVNVDTRNGGTGLVFDIVRQDGTGDTADLLIDDVYILNGAGTKNNDLLGDTAVYTLLPDGNGTYSGMVGSDGNSVDNYQLVDEPDEPNSADWVGSDVDGTKDTYTFGNLPPTTGTVVGVTASLYAAKSDAGTKSVRAVVRRGGVDATGADKTLAMDYAPHDEVMESDPTDGTDWTIGNVNAAEFGAEVRP